MRGPGGYESRGNAQEQQNGGRLKQEIDTGRDRRIRLAAIDIGSNAMRCVVAEVRRSGGSGGSWALRELDYLRAPVRLGQQAFGSGRLTAEGLDAATAALEEFRGRMDEYGVARYRAVATSAVREAANGGELVERARARAGIEIEVIDGAEEARLVWSAVRERLEVRGRWLLVDLGGGSLEVTTVRDDAIERSDSHPLGTVRLLERLSSDRTARGSGEGDAVDRLLDGMEEALAIPPACILRGMMATGGNIEALAELAGAPREGSGAARLGLDALSRIMAELESMSYRERVDGLGLRPDRADVIVPAGRIYRRVARLAGVAEIVVPNVGVTDGLLVELRG